MLETISLILTLIIGLLAVYVAYQQHRTSSDKLRLDLYEKRFSVYNGFREVLREVEISGIISNNGLKNFFQSINECDFLFNTDIKEYKNTFKQKLTRLQQVSDQLVGLLNEHQTEENKKLWEKPADEKEELQNWFNGQSEEIKNRFGKYLDFKKIILF